MIDHDALMMDAPDTIQYYWSKMESMLNSTCGIHHSKNHPEQVIRLVELCVKDYTATVITCAIQKLADEVMPLNSMYQGKKQ